MDTTNSGKSLETEGLSELSLGIRELFRILIPGAYAVVVWEWIQGELTKGVVAESKLTLLILSVIVGLVAYGLQVHERWAPWYLFFNRYRKELNSAIKRAAGKTSDKDYVYEYKYFLETHALGLKDRIHYFSSFYYMLTEMSLISVLGGVVRLYRMFKALNSPPWLVLYLLVVAAFCQLSMLYWDAIDAWMKKRKMPVEMREKLKRAVPLVPIGLVALWFASNLGVAIGHHAIWPLGQRLPVDWRFWELLTVAVVFERLGTKQWKSVINEQIALVKDRNADVKGVIIAATGGGTEGAETAS